jgi:hypothetical protein
MAKRLLKRNRRDICQPGILLLEGRKQSGKVIVGELFALLFVSSRAGMQAPIVNEADTPKRLSKKMLLFIGWVESVLVRPLAHCLFALSLFLDMLLQSSQALSVVKLVTNWRQCAFVILFSLRRAKAERSACPLMALARSTPRGFYYGNLIDRAENL